jgi:hypothetical protein
MSGDEENRYEKRGARHFLQSLFFFLRKFSSVLQSIVFGPRSEQHDVVPNTPPRGPCACISQSRASALPRGAPGRRRLHYVALRMRTGGHRSYRSARQPGPSAVAAHASGCWRQCVQHLDGVDRHFQVGELHDVRVLGRCKSYLSLEVRCVLTLDRAVEQLLDCECVLQGAQRNVQARASDPEQGFIQRQVHWKDHWRLRSVLCLTRQGQGHCIQASMYRTTPRRVDVRCADATIGVPYACWRCCQSCQ